MRSLCFGDRRRPRRPLGSNTGPAAAARPPPWWKRRAGGAGGPRSSGSAPGSAPARRDPTGGGGGGGRRRRRRPGRAGWSCRLSATTGRAGTAPERGWRAASSPGSRSPGSRRWGSSVPSIPSHPLLSHPSRPFHPLPSIPSPPVPSIPFFHPVPSRPSRPLWSLPVAAGDGGGSLQAGELAHPRAPPPGGLLRGALPGRQHPRPLPRHHPGGRRLLPAPGGDGAAHRLQAGTAQSPRLLFWGGPGRPLAPRQPLSRSPAGGGAPAQRQAAPRPLLRRLQPPAALQPGVHRPAQAGLQPGGAHRQLLPGALHPGADGGAGGRRRGSLRRRDFGPGGGGAEPGRLRLHQVRPVAAGRRQPGAGRPPAAAPPPAGPAGQWLPGGAAAGLHGRAAAPGGPQRAVPAHGAAARRGAEVPLAAGGRAAGTRNKLLSHLPPAAVCLLAGCVRFWGVCVWKYVGTGRDQPSNQFPAIN